MTKLLVAAAFAAVAGTAIGIEVYKPLPKHDIWMDEYKHFIAHTPRKHTHPLNPRQHKKKRRK